MRGVCRTYEAEPGILPEVRALPAHLEVLPAFLRPFLGEASVVDFGILVVFLDQVVDDGARLPLVSQ